METKSLKFEIFSGRLWKWFTVKFDSDSPERNRLMEVDCDGFLLDVVELVHTHPALYKEIKIKMAKVAANEHKSDIPTLAYQNKSKLNPVFFYTILFLLLPAFSFAQAHLDFGGGLGREKISYVDDKGDNVSAASIGPVFKLSAGYQFGNNIVTEAVMQPSITRKTNASNYFGIKAGYNFHNIIPQIGYLYNYRNADDVSVNGWEVGYALKYQVRLNDNGGLYAEGMYANKCIQLTAGFHVIF